MLRNTFSCSQHEHACSSLVSFNSAQNPFISNPHLEATFGPNPLTPVLRQQVCFYTEDVFCKSRKNIQCSTSNQRGNVAQTTPPKARMRLSTSSELLIECSEGKVTHIAPQLFLPRSEFHREIRLGTIHQGATGDQLETPNTEKNQHNPLSSSCAPQIFPRCLASRFALRCVRCFVSETNICFLSLWVSQARPPTATSRGAIVSVASIGHCFPLK